jgi:hypothetical protein
MGPNHGRGAAGRRARAGLCLLVALFGAAGTLAATRSAAQDGSEPPADAPKQDDESRGPLRDLAPSWRPGSAWTVVTNPLVFSSPKDPRAESGLHRDLTKKISLHFQVKDVTKLEDVSCLEVSVASEFRPGEEVTLVVRAQDLSLKELRTKDKSSGQDTVISNGRTPFVCYETSALIPYDFPLFPRETKSEERTFDLGSGRKVVQKITLDADRVATIVLTTTVGGDEIVTTQRWKRGLPFWSSATRTRAGKVECSAELDESSIQRPGSEGGR